MDSHLTVVLKRHHALHGVKWLDKGLVVPLRRARNCGGSASVTWSRKCRASAADQGGHL